MGVGRIVLVAVDPDRQGWHLRLLAEATRLFTDRSVKVAHMTTQATNRAVIRNCEKLGYRYGKATHIMARSRGRR
jgi:dTDP-4-amino-4,6-dideoxy-D-galactose acyltransferase